MSLSPGTRLGPYEIRADLGAGGMGDVYRAHDTRLGREVAIKVSREQFSERFDREARAVAALNHPNICHLYDVGPNYLVMELIEGPTLAGRIAEGAIPLDEALPIARQIADALEAAHDKGIVHRDLKPGNVKITHGGSVKVLDFGLAKVVTEASPLTSDSPTEAVATRMGTILGTAAYMAPEQARGKVVDKRADIWAFGVVLCEMLTGRRLFQGEDVTETLAAVVKDQPDLSAVPPQLRRLLRKCLEKDPRKRLRDISGIELLLEEADAPAPTPAASHRWWLWPAAGVLIASLAWVPWPGAKPAIRTDLPLQRLDVDLGKDVEVERAPGSGSRFAISPDGGRLVYMSRRRLFTRLLDRTESTELMGAEDANAPFFSPDGKWVGFLANGKLMKIPAAGGSPTVISDAVTAGASWGDNDVIVAAGGRAGLLTVPASGGTPTRITKLAPGEATHVWPQMLPGGKAVLFTSNASDDDGFGDAKIEAVTLRDGRRKVIQQGGTYGRYIPGAGGPGHLIYVHEGTLFAVAFDPDKLQELGVPAAVAQNVATGTGGAAQLDFARDGSLIYRLGGQLHPSIQLSWVGPSGVPDPLPLKPDDYRFVRVSPDGQKIGLTVAHTGGIDLLVYDWKRDVTTRLTFDGKVKDVLAWSPDGRFIVFAGDGGILWTRADGGGKPQLLHQGNGAELPWSFAPDGKRISISENGTFAAGPNSDIWTLPVESDAAGLHGGKPEVFLQTPFREGRSAFSPDGRWLAYTSNEAGGGQGVYVRGFPDRGGKWQVASDGDSPRWSPPGHDLAFLDNTSRSIFKVSYTVKGDTFAADKARVWIPDQKKFIVGFDITPDGQRAVVLERLVGFDQTSAPGHLMFLMHFADELARRASATR